MRVEERALRKGLPSAQVVRTGMGREKSLRIAEDIRRRDFDVLVVAGVCGSLDSSFRAGHVIVPSAVSAHDVGSIACTVDPALVQGLRDAGLTVHDGTLVCAEKLVTNKKAIEQHKGSGAIAVDMESAWLATAAGDRPVVVVRVASDSPDQPLFHPGTLYWGAMSLRRLAKVGRVLASWSPQTGDAARPT